MGKDNMNDLIKRRVVATQQASELQASDEAYEKLFRKPPPSSPAAIRDLPLDKLHPFFTADIGFKPYSPAKLKAFSEQLSEEGLMVRIIVRPMAGDCYEILAGHNRANAARLAGWTEIPSEIVEADDERAIVIATSTNLIQRQELSIIERGKAYKALLDAKNRHGQWNAWKEGKSFGDNRQNFVAEPQNEISGDNRQKYNARTLVAEFFGVTEYEVRKAVKLTYLIPELADILENNPKQLNLACADFIADYDADSQQAFIEICSIIGTPVNKATVQHIVRRCPPPKAGQQDIFEAWREARRVAEKRLAAPPKKISFDRRKFAPYLDKLGSDRELENLFLEFLRERVK